MSSSNSDSPASRCLLFLAISIALIAVGLNAASLALPQWLVYSVNSTAAGRMANSSHLYYNRQRGVFLTCLTDSASASVWQQAAYKPQVKFDSCYENDFGQLASDKMDHVSGGLSFLMLRRWHAGLQLASGASILLAVVIAAAAFAFSLHEFVMVSIAISCFSAGLMSASIIVFDRMITMELLPPSVVPLRNSWSQQLSNATEQRLGLSYYLACASAGACLLVAIATAMCSAAILHSVTGAEEENDKDELLNSGNNNNGYDGYNGHDGYNGNNSSGDKFGNSRQQDYVPAASVIHTYHSGPPSQQSGGRLPRTPVAYPQNMY